MAVIMIRNVCVEVDTQGATHAAAYKVALNRGIRCVTERGGPEYRRIGDQGFRTEWDSSQVIREAYGGMPSGGDAGLGQWREEVLESEGRKGARTRGDKVWS